MKWDELIEEKNKRIEELEAKLEERSGGEIIDNVGLTLCKVELADAKKLIQWVYDTLKPPIELTKDNKLPAVRVVRERLGEFLAKQVREKK